jgi:hypothetical protein
VFNISGASPGATCTATEPSVPAGYTRNQADCQNGDPLNGYCTIVNTKDELPLAEFTVYLDYEDNNPASVPVSLNCSNGIVLDNPQMASESAAAVFSIEGAGNGATCVASLTLLTSGYTAIEDDCQDGDPLGSYCSILIVLDTPQVPEIISMSNFEHGNPEGWTLKGDVEVDGILAIGQYSLRHMKGATSEHTVSTVGFRNVAVTMNLAGTSLKKNDVCLAEVSTNGGASWMSVVEVHSGNDNGSFRSGYLSSSGADNRPDLTLRFSANGPGTKGGYCYGDEVIVTGVPVNN